MALPVLLPTMKVSPASLPCTVCHDPVSVMLVTPCAAVKLAAAVDTTATTGAEPPVVEDEPSAVVVEPVVVEPVVVEDEPSVVVGGELSAAVGEPVVA